jgi:hypothetical protein
MQTLALIQPYTINLTGQIVTNIFYGSMYACWKYYPGTLDLTFIRVIFDHFLTYLTLY